MNDEPHAPKDTPPASFQFDPGIHYAGDRNNFYRNGVWIVSSLTDAETAFSDYLTLAVLCIDIPRCELCTSLMQASEFYRQKPV